MSAETVARDARPNRHPLEPLSAEELGQAAAIVRDSGRLAGDTHFSCAFLEEPSKAQLRAHASGAALSGVAIEREARVLGWDSGGHGGFDAVVSLDDEKLLRFHRITEGQAPLNFGDLLTAIKLTKADPDWQAALRKRGVEDFEFVQVDPWPAGGFLEDAPPGTRMLRTIAFVRTHKTDNGYARPVHGVIAHVDLTSQKVIRVEDTGVVPFPPEAGNYDSESVPVRQDLRPLEITQPQGPSFQVDGHAIRWQRWQLRISLHPTHGLVLHDVGYEDGGEVRKLLHRAGLAEMVVPYGDPSPMHRWKHVFDAGEICMGSLVNSLELGCDCLGEIHYFDAPWLGVNGDPVTVKNAICMHEEDYGVLWKHRDLHGGTTEVRRSRRLVLSAFHTVGNYEYGFFWYFYQDGTIQMEVKLTGIVGVSAVAPGGGTDTAPLIAPQLASPIHQHLFCFRLDFALDGEKNSVYEVNVEPDAVGPDNPHGSTFRPHETLLARESQAQRIVDPSRSRSWKVVNPNRLNRLGAPVAYQLVPAATATMMAAPDSPQGRRAGFARHNLWVTAFDPEELSAAGFHINQHPGGGGLPAFAAKDRPLENTDVVLWHCFGLTHIPRPEDWPVMPCEYAGFHLRPVGFFDRNPGLDVPPGNGGHCRA